MCRKFLRCGHFLKRRDLTGRQARAALQKHARVDVARHLVALVVLRDVVKRVQQRPHMIPVPVRESDSLHIGQGHAHILAISEKEWPLGPGIEQQFIVLLASIGSQDERQTELRAAQRAT